MSVQISSRRLWAGRIISGLAVLFLSFDTVVKFTTIAPVVDSFRQLGFPVSLAPTIGTIELICLAAYLFQGTSILGAILLTGFLGGAIVTHLRVGDPLFSHTIFPLYVAALVWGGLYLRDARLRILVSRRAFAALAAN